MARKSPDKPPRRILNKKARHDYHILQTLEAGIVLTGSEVKSLRAGTAQLNEAFVRINGTKLTLYGCQIDRYPPATDRNHEPLRNRRLMLHKREILKLTVQLVQAGSTLIPLSIYFNDRGLAKVELALVTGKREYDKRQDLRKKEHRREMDRAMNKRER
ncbi:MAG TPA: SsrA-binding protein SmpB [Phycisphaerae bacterium]|nr:SsrA-binding protein SmpB [Phycisphaerae bacterium]HRY66487.1 SsrA-binding protein SmpB [Phycisphaerae bacterium]HSA25805.1 SsrA-binding protein SmpB [Phycisphaerae bacterium]